MIVFDIDEQDDLFIGEDKSLIITVYQSDKRTRQNILGWSLSWMLKTSLSDVDGSALLTKTTNSGISLTTPSTGVCTVTIADTDTDGLTPGKYFHELKRTDAGAETVLSHGRCVLRRGVHRS
jgi:hypothetical protein